MNFKRLLTSWFGLGLLPKAPGTWGSLGAVLIFALSAGLSGSVGITAIVTAATAATASVCCVLFAPAVVAMTGREDPGEVVADEVAGQAVTYLLGVLLIGQVLTGTGLCVVTILGFLFFRVFDIFKPWPIKKLEKFPRGWGILSDDLMAGVFGGLVLWICYRFGLVRLISEAMVFDGDLNVFSATLLGIVQGITEFLPVSSSGHLVLLEHLMDGLDPESPKMLMFDLAIHAGTLIAIFVVFRKSMGVFFTNILSYSKYGSKPVDIYKKSPSVRFAVLAVITTFVTGVLGIAFKDKFEAARGNLGVVALMWVITATLLLITDLRKKSRLGLRHFGIWAAVVVGIAQGFAIMPGISRSGATICVAILIGLHRRWAVEYSFLIAIPAILGATLITFVKDFSQLSSENLNFGVLAVGVISAAIVGILSLKLVIRASRKANLKYFSIYCYILAAVVWFYLL